MVVKDFMDVKLLNNPAQKSNNRKTWSLKLALDLGILMDFVIWDVDKSKLCSPVLVMAVSACWFPVFAQGKALLYVLTSFSFFFDFMK